MSGFGVFGVAAVRVRFEGDGVIGTAAVEGSLEGGICAEDIVITKQRRINVGGRRN